ncbi:MAG: ATP-binding protein [Sulfitobacter sp.]|uniref:ATP-binding protein n=1 Tax=Sulfitobacter sp. TaxID=1903071 RepID=UPI00329755DA
MIPSDACCLAQTPMSGLVRNADSWRLKSKLQMRIYDSKHRQLCPHRGPQMISNLLANAVTHGALGAPIHVGAGVTEGFFSLSVTNSGKKISDDLFPNPFLPFERRKAPPC